MHAVFLRLHTLCIRYSYARIRYAYVTHALPWQTVVDSSGLHSNVVRISSVFRNFHTLLILLSYAVVWLHLYFLNLKAHNSCLFVLGNQCRVVDYCRIMHVLLLEIRRLNSFFKLRVKYGEGLNYPNNHVIYVVRRLRQKVDLGGWYNWCLCVLVNRTWNGSK